MNHTIQEDIQRILDNEIQWEKLKGKTVLITGVSGMIGGYIARTMVTLNNERGFGMKLYGIVRNPEKLTNDLRDAITIIRQSVTESIPGDERFDYVIHTASPASPLIMKDDPVGTIAANVLGTWNTLQVAKSSDAEGYLFISSREIYGEPDENQSYFTENTYGFVDPLDPRSCYPEGKKAAETMCVCFQKQYGLKTKAARLAHTFGPGMSIDDGRVQADFFRDVVNNRDIVLKSAGTAVRTYTYISDAVAGIFYILLNSPAQEVAYNISTTESTVSIKELAEAMVDAYPERGLSLNFDIPEKKGNDGTAPFSAGILSSEKLIQLGWKPQVSLKEGIKRTVEYLESCNE